MGSVPDKVKVKESLLGSSAVTIIVAVSLTVILTSVGPVKILGGKFSAKYEHDKNRVMSIKKGRKSLTLSMGLVLSRRTEMCGTVILNGNQVYEGL